MARSAGAARVLGEDVIADFLGDCQPSPARGAGVAAAAVQFLEDELAAKTAECSRLRHEAQASQLRPPAAPWPPFDARARDWRGDWRWSPPREPRSEPRSAFPDWAPPRGAGVERRLSPASAKLSHLDAEVRRLRERVLASPAARRASERADRPASPKFSRERGGADWPTTPVMMGPGGTPVMMVPMPVGSLVGWDAAGPHARARSSQRDRPDEDRVRALLREVEAFRDRELRRDRDRGERDRERDRFDAGSTPRSAGSVYNVRLERSHQAPEEELVAQNRMLIRLAQEVQALLLGAQDDPGHRGATAGLQDELRSLAAQVRDLVASQNADREVDQWEVRRSHDRLSAALREIRDCVRAERSSRP